MLPLIAEQVVPASLTLNGPATSPARSQWQRLSRGPWLLVAILAVQAALSLRLIWSNTAFGDEALYLWAGHLEWTHWEYGTPIPNFTAYFSGAPVLYPPLAAMADSVAGLAGARILSLLSCSVPRHFCIRPLTAYSAVARRRCSPALFVGVGPTADLGAFATYDAMAIFLLALATRLAISSGGREAELLLACAAVSMALADSAKYASLLWNPVVIALAALAAPGGFRGGATRATADPAHRGSAGRRSCPCSPPPGADSHADVALQARGVRLLVRCRRGGRHSGQGQLGQRGKRMAHRRCCRCLHLRLPPHAAGATGDGRQDGIAAASSCRRRRTTARRWPT